jgi:hypothetical protein
MLMKNQEPVRLFERGFPRSCSSRARGIAILCRFSLTMALFREKNFDIGTSTAAS